MTSDAEIARNPHQPKGWRRDGIDFFVAPPPRCTRHRVVVASRTRRRRPRYKRHGIPGTTLNWLEAMWANGQEHSLKRSALFFDLPANTPKCGFHLEKGVETLGIEVLASPVGHDSGDLIVRVSRAVNSGV